MSVPIRAIYENGVFKPLETLNLPEHQQVQLTVEPAQGDPIQAEQTSLLANDQGANDQGANGKADPLAGIRATTGIPDLAEHFDDYRFGKRRP